MSGGGPRLLPGLRLHPLALALEVLQVLEVARGGRQRELLRQEVVACVAGGDVADLAAASEGGDVFHQDDLHLTLLESGGEARPHAGVGARRIFRKSTQRSDSPRQAAAIRSRGCTANSPKRTPRSGGGRP